MKIEFTKEEYQKLFDLIFLGELVASSSYDEDDLKEGNSPYRGICQKIYSRAVEMDLKKFVDLDKETNEYWPSRYYEDHSSSLEMFHEHGDESFWQELVARLAERDVCREMGEKKRAKLDPMKYIKVSHPYYEKYQDEFSEHGLNRLVVNGE